MLLIIGNITSASSLENLYKFSDNQSGYASLNSKDGSLLITYFENDKSGLYWYSKGKVVRQVKNFSKGIFSPNGKYYTTLKGKTLYVNFSNGEAYKKFIVQDIPYDLVAWAYNSMYFYKCDWINKETILYRYDVERGTKQQILKSNGVYFHPVTVKNENIIYLLKNLTPDEAGWYCEIVKYDIQNKKFEPVKLAMINNLWISDDFTVSPDEKIYIFYNNNDGIIYVVDSVNSNIIDKIKTPPMESQPGVYFWNPDGSYLIFTMTQKEIYKYTPPKK